MSLDAIPFSWVPRHYDTMLARVRLLCLPFCLHLNEGKRGFFLYFAFLSHFHPTMSREALSVGIDFGGTSVKIGVIEEHQIIDSCKPISTQGYETPTELIREIAKNVKSLCAQHPNVAAIGVGVPGFVNIKKGLIYQLVNVPGWTHIPLSEQLGALCDLPCIIENDANCMAYAEWQYGAGKNMEHLLCLTLGTGVGSGIISNNKLLHGSHSTAGELGQTSIYYRGIKGAYGNLGALECYIGNKQITAEALKQYERQGSKKSPEECTPAALTQASLGGDTIAIDIWRGVAEKLASAIVNACWLLNPEAIIIGGGVAKAGAFLFEPLDTFIRTQLSTPFYSHLKILPAHFDNDAGMIGAAALARASLDASPVSV